MAKKHRGSRFEIKKTEKGIFYFTLHASNGQVIAKSAGYLTKSGVENGIASVRKHSGRAPIVYND